MSTCWVVAAGSSGRDYSKLFLRFGIAFFGSGADRYDEIKVGDTIILRQGREKIVAAGRVVSREDQHSGVGDKEWLSDVDGWYLPAWCYVDWKEPEVGPISVTGFGRQPPTLFQSTASEPRHEAERILATGCPLEGTGCKEPEKTKLVKDKELLETLVIEGLSTSSANELTNTVAKIRLLADYYYHHSCDWSKILEHETRTFLVVPLLLALGWSEQQMKIELSGGNRKKIDIACFGKPYKSPEESSENCVAIIETKGFASGLDYAQDQAKLYSGNFPNCKALITTNGYCYKIYLRNKDGSFPGDPYDPSAYINLLNPRDKYPLNPKEGNGALDAIKWLLPNNLIQTA